ncbi:MAG: CPBP family intramembrane metalloprotease [Bacteroidales bacterium]|nr:CPBP family intramembrane metalloprotease [Bacteroidales bacterium]
MISSFFKDIKPGRQFVGLLLMLVVGLIVSSGILLLSGISGHEAEHTTAAILLQGFSQIIMFMIPATLFAIFFYGNPANYLCIGKNKLTSGSWLRALCAIGIMLLCVPFADLLSQWNDAWHLPSRFASVENAIRHTGDMSKKLVETFLSQTDALSLALNLLIIAAVPACCEELFFRGCIQQVLHRWLRNPHWAIILTALVFSLMHGELFALIPRFFMGVVLGYLFYSSGALVVSIAAHFANNATTVILYYLYNTGHLAWHPENLPSLPLWAIMLTLAGATIMFCYTIPRKENTR